MKIENKRDFNKFLLTLKTELPSIILVQSKEPFEGKVLLDQLISSIEAALGEVEIFRFNEKTVHNIQNELQSYSFSFGIKRVYLCECLDSLTQAQKAPLEAYIENFNPRKVLILTSQSTTPTSALYKKVLKTGILVDIPVPSNARSKEASTREWIVSYITAKGKKIPGEIIDMLSKEYANDRFLLQNEIDKLLLFTLEKPEITKEDLKILSPHSEKGALWKLSSFIMERDIKNALSELHILFEEDVHPLQVLRYLRIRFRLFLEGALLFESGVVDIKDHLVTGKAQLFDKDLEVMRRSGASFFKNTLFEIDQKEVDLKNSSKDPNLVLEMMIANIGSLK